MLVGTILEANFAEEGRWHACQVVDINDEGLTDVKYLSGETENCVLPDNVRGVSATGRAIIRAAMKRDVASLVKLLTDHVESSDAQRIGCSALGIMSIADKSGAIPEAGGLEAICKGLLSHPDKVRRPRYTT